LHDDRNWQKWLVMKELANATVLIIDTGNIGNAIVSRTKALGMRVWGGRRHPQPLPNFD
jgi:phosphoglycerate dehydrogenase-like enzyme